MSCESIFRRPRDRVAFSCISRFDLMTGSLRSCARGAFSPPGLARDEQRGAGDRQRHEQTRSQVESHEIRGPLGSLLRRRSSPVPPSRSRDTSSTPPAAQLPRGSQAWTSLQRSEDETTSPPSFLMVASRSFVTRARMLTGHRCFASNVTQQVSRKDTFVSASPRSRYRAYKSLRIDLALRPVRPFFLPAAGRN